MKKIERVEHEGVITEISEDFITVEIVNKSACAACHAKGFCVAGEEQTRYVDVPYNISTLVEEYKVGDRVNLVLNQSLGVSAVFISYAIPLVILIFLLLILSNTGLSELAVGLLTLAGIAVYYLFVFLFRNRLERIFTFSIEKIN
ncbi:MAG: SoxR reducing system RseC family protein [Bacteroidales bacterium]|nr:SoxR reducing system RseC family protein [Bacteroidales bacterium]MBO7480211.1 SoxR reducing system RseC family protein [Bacteroidales bacterium]MBO7487215.1 SoxR reducing system RseC family protein [Bacteroidales bacterium]